MKLTVIPFFFLIIVSSYAFSRSIEIKRDLSYQAQSKGVNNLLDVYYPKNTDVPKDVLVFIHGGSWNRGKKDSYWWLGRNMANKNVVSVIINYSLSPEYQYERMAFDCAAALKWVKDSVASYGGRPGRIFVMGHSAGGHLAALINNDPRFFKREGIPNPIHAVILNDAFGLDMFEYLNVAEENDQTDSFLNTFSKNKEIWKTGSPINYLENVKNPFLIFVGERTYPAIKLQSNRLFNNLLKANKSVEINIQPKKRHIGMIFQMICRGNQMYNMILSFMSKV